MGVPKIRVVLPQLRWFLPIFIILTALACGQPKPIKLGFLGGLSGRVADLGISGRDGAQLAVELRNQAGGVNGRKVVLLVKDDKQDPDVARAAAKDLLDKGVTAIIGPMTSDMAVAVTPLLNQAKVVAVAPTATTEALSGKEDYLLRVCATTKPYGTHSANYQLKTKRMRRVAGAYDLENRNFSENWINAFFAALTKGGGEMVDKIGFFSGKVSSYGDIARRMLAAKPDGIVIVANAVDTSLLCQQIRKIDPNIPMTASNWAAQDKLIELGGRAVEGVTVTQTLDRNNPSPRYQEFLRIYEKRFGHRPGYAGVYAYDAANLMLDALARQAGEGSLKEAIISLSPHESLRGPLFMDQFGDITKVRSRIAVVKDGKFVIVE